MHPNNELIQKFYSAFQKKDSKTMNECYHDTAEFKDPVFLILPSWKTQAMWSMLCERAVDLEIFFKDIRADENQGQAHWEGIYTFSKTGHKVHNKVKANFVFKDGKILKHTDRFNLWHWAGMALGFKGYALGWLPTVKKKIRTESLQALDLYIKRNRIQPK